MDPKIDLLEVAQSIGVPVPARSGGPLVQMFRPTQPASALPRSMSMLFDPADFYGTVYVEPDYGND